MSRADATGNGHTLTDFNNTPSVDAIIGRGAQFSVAAQRRLIADHDATFNVGNADWEMCAWVYISNTTYQQVITKNSTQRGAEWALIIDNSSKFFQWAVRNTSDTWVIVSASTFGILPTASWFFVDVYHDAANDQIGIAINSGSFNTAALSGGSLATSTAKIVLSGNDNDTPNSWFGGILDDVGVWDRLLTAGEQIALYNSGIGLVHPFNSDPPIYDYYITGAGDIAAARALLIDEVWTGDGLPATGADAVATGVTNPISATGFTNLVGVDQLTINMATGFSSAPYVFNPTSSNGKLALVHQGHSTNINEAGVGDTIRALSNAGYTVVAFVMIGEASVVTHNTYPTPTEDLNHLRYFLEPCVRAINELAGDYDEVCMCGLSGGGWQTLMLAAIDPRIGMSIPVAAELPLDRSAGSRDWEQLLPGLTITDYYDIMALSCRCRTTTSLRAQLVRNFSVRIQIFLPWR